MLLLKQLVPLVIFSFRFADAEQFIAKTPSELIRRRGYLSEEHFLVTSDGYILSLIRASNPLVKTSLPNKDIVLFIHGINTNANCFLLNSRNVSPKDYSSLEAGRLNQESLMELLRKDPAANSLAFTALNFGHEIWLLNRRGTSFSQGHKKHRPESSLHEPALKVIFDKLFRMKQRSELGFVKMISEFFKSFFKADTYKLGLQKLYEPKFWNYSLDEQARYDVPEVIEYVLRVSNRKKLSVVGHSAGGALTLMAASIRPELAKKISKALLWAPALSLGGTGTINAFSRQLVKHMQPIMDYIGPVPALSVGQVELDKSKTSICDRPLARATICRVVLNTMFGKGAEQLELETDAIVRAFEPVSSHEFVSLLQSIETGKMHLYDYHDRQRNLIAYGQEQAPIYNVSAHELEDVSIWYGTSDNLVTPHGIDILIDEYKGNRSNERPLAASVFLSNTEHSLD